MSKITIDLDKVSHLVEKSGEVVLSNEAEKEIIELYKLQAKIESAIDEMKTRVSGEALKLNPNFKSIQSDNLAISFRSYGARYRLDESRVPEMDERLYSVVKRYSPNVEAIDSYVEQTGKIPLGVIEPERPKQLTIKIKEGIL